MKINIDTNAADQRFDRFMRKLCKPYPSVKLTMIFTWMRKGVVKVNGRKQKENYRLQLGDEVTIDVERAHELSGEKGAFTSKKEEKNSLTIPEIQKLIIFEDDQRLVFNKPAGIVMHGGTGQKNALAMQDYLQRYADLTGIEKNETFAPQFCYRLDKDTSGVLIAAKTYEALQFLNQVIRERKIKKVYHTLVRGQPKDKLVMNKPLKKIFDKSFGRGKTVVDPTGLEAYTESTVLASKRDDILGEISLLEVRIKTGRMHQIRVHLADAGYPVLGDIVYGHPPTNRKMYKKHKIPRQLLHCHQYSFFDAIQQKQQTFSAPDSEDILKLIY